MPKCQNAYRNDAMLVSADITVARRLLGQSPTWADYARGILKEAHDSFTVYGSRIGTGPWYVVRNAYDSSFTMKPFDEDCHSFHVLPDYDSDHWIFEIIA